MITKTRQYALQALPDDPDALISAHAVSAFTGIAEQTHTRWRHEGNGPLFVRLGRRIFYRSGDLRQWVRESVCKNTIK